MAQKIVFTRCGSARCELWTVKYDGTGFKRVGPECLRKTSCIDRSSASCSPGSRRIAFGQASDIQNERPKDSEIYVMNANGALLPSMGALRLQRPPAQTPAGWSTRASGHNSLSVPSSI